MAQMLAYSGRHVPEFVRFGSVAAVATVVAIALDLFVRNLSQLPLCTEIVTPRSL